VTIIAADPLDAPPSRFERIQNHVERHGLWCFPVGFFKNAESGNYDKIPRDKWKDFQSHPPTRERRDGWRVRFPYATAAAIPTGPSTGIFVLDADGLDAIKWIEFVLRGVPDTVIVKTKRGFHYYFQYPCDLLVHNSAGGIHPGVDIRGIGGMAIAAGSLRPDGFVYRYEPGHALGEVAIAPAPDCPRRWLEEQNTPRNSLSNPQSLGLSPNPSSHRPPGPFRRAAPPDFAALAAGIPVGSGRDEQIFKLACWLRRRGYTPQQTLSVVLDAGRRCKPPFPEKRAAEKVANAERYL
jgi:hypothetical protein